MYNNVKILLASKHQKERAIEPAFESAFNASIFTVKDYDTDRFGTFTGEIPRIGSPKETLIKKAIEASEKYQCDYVISSEGSFGPHPVLHFCSADIELICFYDKKKNITIIESEISTETNFNHIDFERIDDYKSYLEKILFPSHAVILRSLDSNTIIQKGIHDIETLSVLINNAFLTNKKLRLETDMRAMHNPTRMSVIEKLANKLILRMINVCEKCDTPGFGIISYEGNLPCEFCGSMTEMYSQKIESCISCDHKIIKARDDGLTCAFQQYCSYCNP